MKIIIDGSQIVYSGHGVGRYVAGLTRALLNIPTEHKFVVYAGALRQVRAIRRLSHEHPYDRAQWKIAPLPPKVATRIFNNTSIPIEAMSGMGDIFHSSDWTQPWSTMKMVTTVHDLAFRHYPETIDPLVLKTQTKRLERVVKFGVHIIVDSQSTKNDLMKLYPLKSEKIDVVYPGNNFEVQKLDMNQIEKTKKKYRIRGKYILSVGTLEPRKNLQKAIKGFELFRQTKIGSEYSLVLAGRYGWGQEVVAPPFVMPIGFVEEQDLQSLYRGADVFLYPSLYEGFGFPVLEAMSSGVPVVTSNVSSLPEVAGDAAILIDPESEEGIATGISKAIHDTVILRKRGLLQAAKFTWENTAEKTIRIYESL
jgi:glycosyltransferase involved in cell wall biosynthesis